MLFSTLRRASSACWLPLLALLVGLGITRDAEAGAKMDWSDYLEPAGSRPAAKAAPAQRPAKAAASKRKASRSVAKKASRSAAKKKGAESRSKKAKRSVRSKRRR
jgi:hypothetical protein